MPRSECSFYTSLQDSQPWASDSPPLPSCPALHRHQHKNGEPAFQASTKQSKNYHNQDVLIRSKIKGEETFLWGNVTVCRVSPNGRSSGVGAGLPASGKPARGQPLRNYVEGGTGARPGDGIPTPPPFPLPCRSNQFYDKLRKQQLKPQ